MADLTLEEELMVQFNNLNVESKSLATSLLTALEASRKRLWDVATEEEELIEGNNLFVKRPCIPRCPDT